MRVCVEGRNVDVAGPATVRNDANEAALFL